MFTGIITDVGRVRSLEQRGDTRFEIETGYDLSTLDIGASVDCSGVCLSVVEKNDHAFAVDVSSETLAGTTMSAWDIGKPVNLERPLRLGDEMGGHIVLGHADGIGTVTDVRSDGPSLGIQIEAPENLASYIAAKGYLAVDGISLMINEVSGSSFGVNVIALTRKKTTLEQIEVGDNVNLEVDILARYVARLHEQAGQ